MLARVWRNWNPQTLLDGIKSDATTLENSLAIPQKVNCGVITWCSSSIPRCSQTQEKSKHRSTQKLVHKCLQKHYLQEPQGGSKPDDKWLKSGISKQLNIIQQQKGKKYWYNYSIDESWKHYTKRKKADTTNNIHDSIHNMQNGQMYRNKQYLRVGGSGIGDVIAKVMKMFNNRFFLLVISHP